MPGTLDGIPPQSSLSMSTSAKPVGAALSGLAASAPRFLPLETISVRLFAPPHTDRGAVFGVISNISETGACIITNRALPVHVAVELEIRLRSGREPLGLTARTVWCALRLEPVKEIVGYLTGVCFDDGSIDDVSGLLASGIFQSVL